MGGLHRRLGLALFLAAVVTVACDPTGPHEAIGIAPAPGGAVEIHVGLCPGERVQAVRLVEAHGGVIGNSDDPVLWSIAAPTGSRLAVYVAGKVPPGFVSRVALSGFPQGRDLAAIVTTTLVEDNLGTFRLSDLRQGRLWADRRSVDRRTFDRDARRHCP